MNPTPPTQTPRTDKALKGRQGMFSITMNRYVIDADFARTIELELLQAQREMDEALEWKEPRLARNQPCGCIICNCEDEERCNGCGSKSCGTHEVGKIPNPVFEQHPLVDEITQLRNAVDELVKNKNHGLTCWLFRDPNAPAGECSCGVSNALTLANNLPHRKERNV